MAADLLECRQSERPGAEGKSARAMATAYREADGMAQPTHICGWVPTSGDCPACVAEDQALQRFARDNSLELDEARAVMYGWEPRQDEPAPSKKQAIPHWLAKQVMERDAYRCQEPGCGTWIDLTVDHIIAESLGGPTELDNLRTLCRPHNSSKGARV
jgi:5-methylcytosine-specific restriction endonuclease McrA